MSLEIRGASRTDVGHSRERNEDSVYAGRHVFAVADGLGGHQAGNVASSMALEPIASLDDVEPKRAARQLAEAVRRANRDVVERAEGDSALRGMGTTLTAIVVDGRSAHLAHVGDSRCYLLRAGDITQVSRDHTLVARMVAEGKLTPEQAETHPQRSMLTRALGADRGVEVDEVEIELEPGDRLLLCSDGLTGMLADDEIRRLAESGSDIAEICGHLVDEANARGGLDNITVVLIDVAGSLEGVPMRRLRAPAPRGGRRVPVRALTWAAVVLVVVVGGYLGVRAWAGRSFYVGVDEGRVAIFKGWPVDVPGMALHSVKEPTALRTEDVQPYYLPRLQEGVTADSLGQARTIVDQIPRVRPAIDSTVSPTPTPAIGPTP